MSGVGVYILLHQLCIMVFASRRGTEARRPERSRRSKRHLCNCLIFYCSPTSGDKGEDEKKQCYTKQQQPFRCWFQLDPSVPSIWNHCCALWEQINPYLDSVSQSQLVIEINFVNVEMDQVPSWQGNHPTDMLTTSSETNEAHLQ